jgi:hypothetical protein
LVPTGRVGRESIANQYLADLTETDCNHGDAPAELWLALCLTIFFVIAGGLSV